MYADNEFLTAIATKLFELADETCDMDTREELTKIAEMAIQTCK